MNNNLNTSRIFIVDDHPMVRDALQIRISIENDLEVCGSAETEDDAWNQIQSIQPDLVLIDISLKEGNGLSLVKRLTANKPKINSLVFSMHAESLYADRCLRAGAMGYLNKQESPDRVIEAIRAVLSGQRFISPAATEQLFDQAFLQRKPHMVSRLSDRELEVFQLIGEGKTTAVIAKTMSISVNTVDTYRQKIKLKIGVKTGPELQREAVRFVMKQAE